VLNLQVLADQLMHILPADGSQMPNDEARTLLGRAVEAPIEGETYFSVIALLERNGEILRGRGRGGAVRRAQPQTAGATTRRRRLKESELMPSLQRYLEARFWRRLELPDDAYWAVIDTSRGGAQDGQWRRCDFTGIAIAPRAVLGGSEVELFTFELKAEGSGNVDAVHEADAQTRGSHYGYLVWHVPDRDRVKARLLAVERECQRKGVGLILFSDSQDLDSFDHRMAAVRRPTETKAVDAFLAKRLDMREMQTIKARLGR
jgi:hypothetical protein